MPPKNVRWNGVCFESERSKFHNICGNCRRTVEVEEGQVARLSWVGLVLGGAGLWYVYPGVSLLETVILESFSDQRCAYVTQVATT